MLCNAPVITKDFLPSNRFRENNSALMKERHPKIRKRHDKQAVLQALKKSGWNRSKAARMLDVNRSTIYLEIKQYGLVENEFGWNETIIPPE